MINLTEYFDSITDRLGYRSKGGDNLLLVEELPKLIAALKLVDEKAKCGKAAFCSDCPWCQLRKQISEILGVDNGKV